MLLQSEHECTEKVTARVFARIGLLGNPSDACNGKAVAVTISNFFCDAACEANDGIEILPNEEHDPSKFSDLGALEAHVNSRGYYGGARLLQATCKMFSSECKRRGVHLPRRGFRLSYSTSIPRQAGLSGSSAIICAAFECLLAWYGAAEAFPVPGRPSLVLSVEAELGITAGLMDRVAQVYGGLVFMDLTPVAMRGGDGRYERLPTAHLPPLWLVYADNPSDSGRVHAPVRQRWIDGDPAVVDGMRKLADIAQAGRDLIVNGPVEPGELGCLMSANFALRRQMYGDAALGAVNLDMIATAAAVGASAKFCGSGGAIVALCSGGEEQERALQDACAKKGYICVKAQVADQNFDA